MNKIYKLPDRYIRLDTISSIDDLIIFEGAYYTSFGYRTLVGSYESVFCHMTDDDIGKVNELSSGKDSSEYNKISQEVQTERTRKIHSDFLTAWKKAFD